MASFQGNLLLAVERGELANHLNARVEYHTLRTEHLMAEAEKKDNETRGMLEDAETVTARIDIKNDSVYNNIGRERDDLRLAAKTHSKKAAAFRFMATHLSGDLFELSRSELVALEFITMA